VVLFSDHKAVIIVSSVMVNLPQPTKKLIYLWAQADFNIVRNNVQTLCDDFLNNHSTSTPADVSWNKFLLICKIQPQLNWFLPSVSTLGSITALSRKQCAYNQARYFNLPKDWSNYLILKDSPMRMSQEI